MIGMNLVGGREADRALWRLGQTVARKVVRHALRVARKPALVAAKSNAQSMVGGEMGALLSKNVQIKPYKRQTKGSYGLSVQMKPDIPGFVDQNAKDERNYIPFAIEFGHDDVAAIPFMRQAADTAQPQAEKIFRRELAKGIIKATRGK